MNNKKKELKREYKQNPPQMGIFQIRNKVNNKVFIGKSLNLQGILNRHGFQLRMGNHQNKTLQTEWNEYGGESFAFEILDELKPMAESAHDYNAELELMEELWLKNLEPYGDRGYNEKKKGQEERLRLISENRSGEK